MQITMLTMAIITLILYSIMSFTSAVTYKNKAGMVLLVFLPPMLLSTMVITKWIGDIM